MRTERTTRYMNSDRLPPHKERFQDHYCRQYPRLLDHDALFVRKQEADGGKEICCKMTRYFCPVHSGGRGELATESSILQIGQRSIIV
jgi:hypothetical protein